MEALHRQLLDELVHFQATKHSITSVFIGGGTPSTIKPELYKDLFTTLKPYLSDDCEITTEANPNSATLTWLRGMQELGITRLSLGVQSFDAKKLAFLGRNHTPQAAIKAVENAHKIGIQNISIDLIYATSLDSKKLLTCDIDQAFALPINHLSSYALSIEQGTVFAGKNHYSHDTPQLARFFIESIKKQGFPQYEISNFGTYKSRHNLGYWSGEDYIGLGAGAVGFLKNQRYYPTKDRECYIKNPLEKTVENLNKEALHVEKIFLGLRCKVGIAKKDILVCEEQKVAILLQEKKVFLSNNRYYNADYLLADEIALYIIS